MALGEAHVNLLGNPGQARADQDAGQVQEHFRGFQVILRLPVEQARHIGHFGVVEQQQRLAGDTVADKALAHCAQAFAAHGVGEGHMQLADFENIHLRHRQLHKDPERLGQQCGGAAHGDVGDLAKCIAEVDLQLIQYRRLGDGARRRLGVEQAEFEQGAAQYLGVGRLLDKGQGAEFLDPA